MSQELSPLGGQAVAPQPEDFQAGLAKPHLADELTGIAVAGGLAAREEQAHGGLLSITAVPSVPHAVAVTVSFPGHATGARTANRLIMSVLIEDTGGGTPACALHLSEAPKIE